MSMILSETVVHIDFTELEYYAMRHGMTADLRRAMCAKISDADRETFGGYSVANDRFACGLSGPTVFALRPYLTKRLRAYIRRKYPILPHIHGEAYRAV